MKMFALITSGVLIQISILTAAQETSLNSFSLEVGAGHIQRQDLVFSPMIHNDITRMNAGLRYTRMADVFQSAALGFASYNPMVTEPYSFTMHGEEMIAAPHLFTFIELDYMLGKRVAGNERSEWILGGVFMSDIQALNYVYGRIGHFGYYATLGAGLFSRLDLSLGAGGNLAVSARVPLVSLLARSPSLVNDDEFIENQSSHSGVNTFFEFLGDGDFATWNSLQYFDIDLSYTFPAGARWDLGVQYGFELIHSSRPRNLLSFQNALQFVGTFNF